MIIINKTNKNGFTPGLSLNKTSNELQIEFAYYFSALYTMYTYRFTSHRLCYISFVLVRSVLSVYHAGGQTRDVYDAEPTLAQYWATVSCLAPR